MEIMAKTLKISHNMDDAELELYLEKALKTVKKYEEPNRNYPDKVAEKIMETTTDQVNKVLFNLISEIQKVINREV